MQLWYVNNNTFNVCIRNCDHSMLRYLLTFVCVYLYIYMLCTITFGYTLFHEIFIHVKLIFLVLRYEVLKSTISSLVQKNQFVHDFTDRVLLIIYSYQTMYIHFLTIQLWMVAVRILCFNAKALSNVSLNHFVHLHSLG